MSLPRANRTAWVGLLSGVVCALAAEPAAAQEPLARVTRGTSQCPAPEAVDVEFFELVPPDRLHELSAGADVEVIDLGDGFRVDVKKASGEVESRTHSDPERDCEARSRFAALFMALTLMPPEVRKDPLREQYHAETKVSAPPPEPEPEPVPDLARIELSAVIEYAPAVLGAPKLLSPGGELRVALGRGPVAGTLAIGYLPKSDFALGPFEGQSTRLPASAGVRLKSDTGRLELALDLGVLVGLERLEGKSSLVVREETTVEVGARSGVVLSYRALPALSPFVGVCASVVPFPREIAFLPRGVVGNTPHLWLGASAGLALSL